MSIVSQEPDPGRSGGITRWDYLATPNPSRVEGWLAQQPAGVWIHRVGAISRPCRRRMTAERVVCEHCMKGLVPEWRGYVPFYSRLYLRWFVVIGPSLLPVVREILPLSQVVITRAKKRCAPVSIEGQNWRTSPLPAGEGRGTECPMMDFLIGVLFRDPVLAAYHASAAVASVSDTGMSPTPATPKPPRKRPAPPGVPVTEADREEGAEELSRVSSRIRGRLAVRALTDGISTPIPSANGQHPPRS